MTTSSNVPILDESISKPADEYCSNQNNVDGPCDCQTPVRQPRVQIQGEQPLVQIQGDQQFVQTEWDQPVGQIQGEQPLQMKQLLVQIQSSQPVTQIQGGICPIQTKMQDGLLYYFSTSDEQLTTITQFPGTHSFIQHTWQPITVVDQNQQYIQYMGPIPYNAPYFYIVHHQTSHYVQHTIPLQNQMGPGVSHHYQEPVLQKHSQLGCGQSQVLSTPRRATATVKNQGSINKHNGQPVIHNRMPTDGIPHQKTFATMNQNQGTPTIQNEEPLCNQHSGQLITQKQKPTSDAIQHRKAPVMQDIRESNNVNQEKLELIQKLLMLLREQTTHLSGSRGESASQGGIESTPRRPRHPTTARELTPKEAIGWTPRRPSNPRARRRLFL